MFSNSNDKIRTDKTSHKHSVTKFQNISVNLPPSGAGAGSRIGPGRCFSQPQTPAEERRSILQGCHIKTKEKCH